MIRTTTGVGGRTSIQDGNADQLSQTCQSESVKIAENTFRTDHKIETDKPKSSRLEGLHDVNCSTRSTKTE